MTGSTRHTQPNPAAEIDRLLREQAPGQVMDSTGRARARFESRAGGDAAPATSRIPWLGMLAAAAAVGFAILFVWTPSPTPLPAAAPALPPAVARLIARLDQTAEALRAAQPEGPILTEARRLKIEVERGVGFVRSVMPKPRAQG